ncbi:hypothetical protein D3C78_894410 [compost metagenome]
MFKFAQTQIVLSSFENRCAKRKRNHFSKHWNIPLSKLFLKIYRMGTNHHLLFLLNTVINSRQKITQRFPCTCPCFNQEMLILFKSTSNFAEHDVLSLAFFILRQFLLKPFLHLLHKLLKRNVLKGILKHMLACRSNIHPIIHLQSKLPIIRKPFLTLLRFPFSFM